MSASVFGDSFLHSTTTNNMSRPIDLPIGTHPAWELEEDPSEIEKVEFHTIAERYVLPLSAP